MDTLASSFISRHAKLRIETRRAQEFIDITERVEGLVQSHDIHLGVVNVQTLHTTTALVVNEHEVELLEDFAAVLGRLAPVGRRYRHDHAVPPVGERRPEEARPNGHAHCRSLVLSSSMCLNVLDGWLALGRWQRLFLVELDGPRDRELSIVMLGEAGR
jgi:secondary thiamine-phosphate synthase enzyme